jgi:hypothetical protein
MRLVFVQVSEDEWDFLQTLRRLVKAKRGFTKLPSLRRIVTGLIRDYRHVLEEKATPDFLDAYRLADLRKSSMISRGSLSTGRQEFEQSSMESRSYGVKE